jgi:hypothetical protein
VMILLVFFKFLLLYNILWKKLYIKAIIF